MNKIIGDLIQLAQAGKFDVIIHGCNCMCAMDAGIAKQIKDAFPRVYEADLKTIKGDRNKLGTCTYAVEKINGNDVHVVNAYTQYDWKGDGVLVDYDSLRSCFKWVKKHHSGKRIGIPKIGAGLARGDWNTVSRIISEELIGENVTLVIKLTPSLIHVKKFYSGGFLYNSKTKSVLLHKRDANTKINPLAWAFFGGLSEGNESPEETFLREIKEELSIDIQKNDTKYLTNYLNEELQTYRHVFYVESDLEKSQMKLGEGADFDWISLEKVFEYDLTDKTRLDLKKFIREVASLAT